MERTQNSKRWILFFCLFGFYCNGEEPKKEDVASLLALGQTNIFSNQSMNGSVIPQEVQSYSPSHRGKFRSAYNEEGIHFQSNDCQSNGTLQLERIAVLDPIEINIEYKESISTGSILLQNSSQVTIPGTISYPNSKTIRFVSTQTGELYSSYKVTVQNVTKTSSGAAIQDATWTFQYDLDGVRGTAPNKIVVDCQSVGGANQCDYDSKFGIGVVSSLVKPQAVFSQIANNFNVYFGLQSSDANGITLWLYEACKIENGTANIAAIPHGKFLFARMIGTGSFAIPHELIEQNALYTGSVYQYYKNTSGIEFGQALYPENIQLITNQH
ncbi:hypothetical protein [Leptospira adleri]|uniref:hypothetical protein n=1 Tax=Leptospira adleri TaxID=2023186 RepID=UPI0010828ACA|nr:hypothetical protein [Leptospira adleri]TGM61610.1 hypothetical protein EHQ97_01225 [Leptospira adleri]